MISQRTRELQTRRRISWFRRGSSHKMSRNFIITARFIILDLLYLMQGFRWFLSITGGTSNVADSDLPQSLVLCSIMHTFLKQLKVSTPTRFLKSNPAIVISLTQRSCSDVGRRRTRLLKVLGDNRLDSNSALSI